MIEMAVGQSQWYHFGVGAPPILVGIGMFTGGYDLDFDPWPNERRGGTADSASLGAAFAACEQGASAAETGLPYFQLGFGWSDLNITAMGFGSK